MVRKPQRSAKTARRALRTHEDARGILSSHYLPDDDFDELWEKIKIATSQRDQLLAQAILNFILRPKVNAAAVPLHGIILLVGPPGTGKTSLARGLASRTAASLEGFGEFAFLEVEPHSLMSASHGKTQKAVQELLGQTVSELAAQHPLIVLLDEVETLAANRARMSLEANPVDVHRATDAVLAQLDHLAQKHKNLLFVATSNFPQAIDEAFLSRADLIVPIGLPSEDARAEILHDTIEALVEAFPELAKLSADLDFAELARLTEGVDGRQLRKAVIGACSLDKTTALNPGQLSSRALKESLKACRRSTGKGAKNGNGH